MTVAAAAAAAAPARAVGRTRRKPVRRTVQLRSTGVNAPTQAKQYFAVLVEFMEFKNKCTYPTNQGEFSFEELHSIKPEHLYAWMADKCYGKEDPGPDDLPQYARASSLAYYKKAISFFMPNKGTAWAVTGDGTGFGNPTRSDKVNGLIKAVRKKETRGTGVKTSADRAFTREEFIQAIELIQHFGDRRMDGLRHQAMMKFQLCMIGRADDTAHAKKDCLNQSTEFPEYLTAKLRWCKNVNEERDCPNQIIFGSMNAKVCTVLGLGIFLERWCSGSGRSSQWLFAEGITVSNDFVPEQDKEAIRCKNNYSKALSTVLKSESFTKVAPGNLGTHSIRKSAVTICRSKGATKDEVDYRARWKQKRMQDRYTEMQLNWPDIRAASKLCDRGTCVYYRVKEGIGITDEFLSTWVCPNITASFSPAVSVILAKALVWACFDPAAVQLVPTGLRTEIIQRINNLIGEEESTDNPIEKLEVIASQEDGTISLDIIADEEGIAGLVDEEGVQVGAATAIGRLSTQWRAAIYAKVSSTATRVTNIEQVTLSKFSALERENKQLKDMLRTLLIAPARIIHPGTANRNRIDRPDVAVRYDGGVQEGAGTAPPATLHKNIQTLELLWDEWENGIGGRKPAKEFTPQERGKNKYAFCRRLGFWTCMERQIARGATVPTAIRRIKQTYTGPLYDTMTKLLRGIKKDEKNGGHHQLR